MSSVVDMWHVPTTFSGVYLRTAILNSSLLSLGFLPVIFMTIVLLRNPAAFKKYKYNVVLITYGCFVLYIPITLQNYLAVVLIAAGAPTADRQGWLTTVAFCTFLKQLPPVFAHTVPALGLIISVVRFRTVVLNRDTSGRAVIIALLLILIPGPLYFVQTVAFGVEISTKLICLNIMTPYDKNIILAWYGLLAGTVLACVSINFGLLLYVIIQRRNAKHARTHSFSQLQLSIAVFLQSLSPFAAFISMDVYMVMIYSGEKPPAWLETLTNVFYSLTPFIDPLLAMGFVTFFRRQLLLSSKLLLPSSSLAGPEESSRASKTTSSKRSVIPMRQKCLN